MEKANTCTIVLRSNSHSAWILENRVCSIYHNELRVALARLKREVSAKRGSRAVSGYG